MSKKSKRRADVKSSILILLLIAILLIASTYAWFTANTSVSISTLDVKVEAQNGLQISVDGTNWKTVLTNDDIKGANATYTTSKNQIPDMMEPVSSAGTVASGVMEMFYGTISSDTLGNNKLSAAKQTDKEENGATATGKYIVFDAFLKVDKTSALSLTKNSSVTAKAGTMDKGLQNAARVAFCKSTATANGSELTTIQGLVPTTSYIWEPNYDVHTSTGVSNAKDVYGITTTQTGGSLLAYNGIKAEIPGGTPVPLNSADTNYFQAVTPAYYTPAAEVPNTKLFDLEAGITKVRIYMWIEGQDVDCENSASGADISYTLDFSIPG